MIVSSQNCTLSCTTATFFNLQIQCQSVARGRNKAPDRKFLLFPSSRYVIGYNSQISFGDRSTVIRYAYVRYCVPIWCYMPTHPVEYPNLSIRSWLRNTMAIIMEQYTLFFGITSKRCAQLLYFFNSRIKALLIPSSWLPPFILFLKIGTYCF